METKSNLEKSLENLKNEELKDIVKKTPSSFLRYGNSILFLLMILTITICSVIKYPEVITGDVIISSEDPPQKIYTNVSSRIDSILINDNDTIKENTVIAILENTAVYEDVQLIKRFLKSFKIKSENLEFPIDNFPILILGEIDEEFANFEDAFIQFTLLNKLKDYDIKSESNLYSVSEKKNELSSLLLQKRLDSKELYIKRKEIKRFNSLFDKGVISKQDLEVKQIELLQSQKNAKNTLVDISELKNEISLSKENLKLNDIGKVRAQKKAYKTLIQDYNSLKISIIDWERKYLIKSSRPGKVSYSKYLRKNDFVKEGELFVSVVPDVGIKPIAKIRTPINRSGKIKIGQSVNIKLDNYPYLEYGMLVGTISNISLMPDDNNLYLIDLKLNNDLETTYNKKLVFKHEMAGSGIIITEDTTLFDRLFNRVRNLISKNQ